MISIFKDDCRGTTKRLLMIHLSQTRRTVIWTLLAAIAGWVCLLAFRGYLSTEMLLNFATAFYC